MARETGLLAAGEQDGGQDTGSNPSSTPPFWRRPTLVVLLAVVLIAAGVLVVVRRASDGGSPPVTRADVDHAVQSGIQKAQQEQRDAPTDAATAFRRILPSLVTIVATHSASRAAAGPGGGGTESDLGTGVVVNASGSILTALHVVDGAERIEVRFTDGTRATASVVQRKPDNDIAVLAPGRLPQTVVPAVLGGSAQVGDMVFPVGNPLGLEDSLTAGVVSALDRSIPTPEGRTLKGLIQFDAAVNPGNSGGPLLDRDGHMVGIVTALANPSHQPYFVGIGFAVPITTAGGAAGGPSK